MHIQKLIKCHIPYTERQHPVHYVIFCRSCRQGNSIPFYHLMELSRKTLAHFTFVYKRNWIRFKIEMKIFLFAIHFFFFTFAFFFSLSLFAYMEYEKMTIWRWNSIPFSKFFFFRSFFLFIFLLWKNRGKSKFVIDMDMWRGRF